jgi:hypothetical protein
MAPTRRPRVVNGPLEKPREPGRLGDLARMTLLGVLLALPAFLYAGLQAQLHEYRREVVLLEERLQGLAEERKRLDIDLQSASDLQRIEELAGLTGLTHVDQQQFIFLPRTPVAPARDLTFLALTGPAEATGDARGRQRP